MEVYNISFYSNALNNVFTGSGSSLNAKQLKVMAVVVTVFALLAATFYVMLYKPFQASKGKEEAPQDDLPPPELSQEPVEPLIKESLHDMLVRTLD